MLSNEKDKRQNKTIKQGASHATAKQQRPLNSAVTTHMRKWQ